MNNSKLTSISELFVDINDVRVNLPVCWLSNIPIAIRLEVAEIPGETDEITSLIQAGDQALYPVIHNDHNLTISFHLIGN